MNKFFYNFNYFIKEVISSFRGSALSNIFSLISIVLIFFILGIIVCAWLVGANLVSLIQDEAEISVFYDEKFHQGEIAELISSIENIQGIIKARVVDEKEAYERMVSILGSEAEVLGVFDSNPFAAYIEVNVDLQQIEAILTELTALSGIEHIRDNKEVLGQLQAFVKALSIIGVLSIATVSISTLIITSHIIRIGIYAKKEQINTLRLLGASERFIALPFFLEGILLAFSAGILALVLLLIFISTLYTQVINTLTFIPMPAPEGIAFNLAVLVLSVGIFFGFVGSAIGFTTANK